MDSYYLNERFDVEVTNTLQMTESGNIWTDEMVDFAYRVPSAILSCMEGNEKIVGALLPVLLDTLKEQYKNKDTLEKNV